MELSSSELAHEEDVLRRPFVLKAWLGYLQALENAQKKRRFTVYERALAALPGSYKLWYAYLKEREEITVKLHPNSPAYERLNTVFERSLVYMHKMPVIWEMYCRNLCDQRRWTRARRACDGALKALPVTQHARIWPTYLRLAQECGVSETGVRVLRRYCKLEPNNGAEELFKFLVDCGNYNEAAAVLAEALEDPKFKGHKRTRQQLWNDLANLAVEQPKQIVSIDVNALIRGGIQSSKEERGELWIYLAEYYARCGIFERSRDIYEEALATVNTVRDFAVVYDSYSRFEEGLVTAKLNSLDPSEIEDTSNIELDMLVSRLERLTERRPYLLSSVILRQNPHNVHEWHKRARLYRKNKDTAGVVNAYTQAVKTVDPWKASNGRPHTLWLAFARFYEDHKDLASARKVFEKAVVSFEKYRSPEDLAAVWCEYTELELRHGDYKLADEVLRRATTEPKRAKKKQSAASLGNANVVLGAGSGGMAITHSYDKELPALSAWRSTRLWSLFADFQESVNGVDASMKVYESMLDLKVAAVPNVLSAARFLEENRHFENAFKIYERGMALFKWPAVLPIQLRYMKLFVGRFGGRKLERARELFEDAIKSAPKEDPNLRILYLLYAETEEKVGLARRAMEVYDRAVRAVAPNQRVDLYRVYAAKAVEMFGVARTRQVFEDALDSLTEKAALIEFTKRFAALETSLGEVDRARGIFAHGAQFADPNGGVEFTSFWEDWHEFEVAHGSEDTYREMLRIKRSVTTQYSFVNVSAAGKPNVPKPEDGQEKPRADDSALAAMEKEAEERKEIPAAENGAKSMAAANEEEIEIDMDAEDDDEDDAEENGDEKPAEEQAEKEEGDQSSRKRKGSELVIEERPIPAAVFGGLVPEKEEDAQEEEAPRTKPLGALERLKRRRG